MLTEVNIHNQSRIQVSFRIDQLQILQEDMQQKFQPSNKIELWSVDRISRKQGRTETSEKGKEKRNISGWYNLRNFIR